MNRDAAHTFLWSHARLIERAIFEYRLLDGSADAVERAIGAYRNADGGFGNALEPDCRTPHSQPEATRWGLTVLHSIGRLDETRAQGCADWLASVAAPEAGVPFCLPSVDGYPKAPWWNAVPEANLTPTGSLVGLLRPHVPDHPWVRGAADWCWEQLTSQRPESQYAARSAADFLATEPDEARARPVFDALGEALSQGRVIPLDPQAKSETPDVHTPLQFAPSPGHRLRRFFSDATIEGFLDRLEALQQADGGWPIDWPAPGETAVNEWRGIRTLEALETLAAYGRS